MTGEDEEPKGYGDLDHAHVIVQGFSKEGLKFEKGYYILKRSAEGFRDSLEDVVLNHWEKNPPAVKFSLEITISKLGKTNETR